MFCKHTDGSLQWIPKQIVTIGEDFHNQVDDGKVRSTLYKVRWEGYDKKDDTWEPISHLQGYATMVKAFKESHAKDLEKLTTDRLCESENKTKDDLTNTPKHTVLSMIGLTSSLWTLDMFQMVTGELCQYIEHTKQTNPCEIGVRHAVCTVPGCGHVIRYQKTSNLEHHYIRGGTDHKELADRFSGTQNLERQGKLGSAADGSMTLSHTCNVSQRSCFERRLRCDIRKVSFTIGLEVCQDTFMSTRRTLMSLACGDSSMVALHLEAG